MLAIATFATLLLFAFVVSQPFFYWVALGAASRALSGPAYVELRQRVNAVMNVRLLPLYAAAAASCAWLAWTAHAHGERLLSASAALALAGLVTDAVLAVRRNVPINAAMDTWSPASPPSDWEAQRARWNAAFASRQAVLAIAFAILLAGAVASG